MIKAYAPWETEQVWPAVQPYIKKALERGSAWTIDEIFEWLRDEKAQLWSWCEDKVTAAMVTVLYDKTCLLLAFGGDNTDSIRCYNLVEDWAIENGCDKMSIHGRKGWSRLLGFTVIGTDNLDLYVMEKRLRMNDGQRTTNHNGANSYH